MSASLSWNYGGLVEVMTGDQDGANTASAVALSILTRNSP